MPRLKAGFLPRLVSSVSDLGPVSLAYTPCECGLAPGRALLGLGQSCPLRCELLREAFLHESFSLSSVSSTCVLQSLEFSLQFSLAICLLLLSFLLW